MNLGRNDLLDTASRNLGRAEFHKDLIFTAVVAVLVIVIWSLN